MMHKLSIQRTTALSVCQECRNLPGSIMTGAHATITTCVLPQTNALQAHVEGCRMSVMTVLFVQTTSAQVTADALTNARVATA